MRATIGRPTVDHGSIDVLLAALRRALPRSAAGRELIAEIGDGLQDAAAAYVAAGLSVSEAERRAVLDYGDVAESMALCRAELEVRRTRRSALVVAVGYPAMLCCWGLFYLCFADVGSAGAGSRQVGNGFNVVGGLTCLAALITIGLLGRRSRTPGRARRWIAIGFAVLTGLSIGITYLLSAVTHAPPGAPAGEVAARLVVQAISTLATVLMLGAAVLAVPRSVRRTSAIRPSR